MFDEVSKNLLREQSKNMTFKLSVTLRFPNATSRGLVSREKALTRKKWKGIS